MRSDNKFVPEAKAHKWLLSTLSVASHTDTQPSRGEHCEIQLGVLTSPGKPGFCRPLVSRLASFLFKASRNDHPLHTGEKLRPRKWQEYVQAGRSAGSDDVT